MSAELQRSKETDMFTTFAKTLFRASGVSPTSSLNATPRSWYREDLRGQSERKRWEDWR
jgi:hypothetical protein